jgi:hypothetical protein
VILSVLTTGLITTLAITSGAQAQVAGLTLKRDQGFYAAEAGIQRAFWLLQSDGNWRTNGTPLTGTIDNGSYSVEVTGAWNSPVTISAVGSINPGASDGSSITVTAIATPSVIVPAISLGKNFNNSGNVVITGDVQAQGIISTSGRFKENGSIYAGGAITTLGSVDISGTTNPNATVPPLPTVDMNALKNDVNTTIIHISNGNGGKATDIESINFGSNPNAIIYFDGGDINFKGNVTITGSGTIVCEGKVSIQAAASFGTSSVPANANIVTAGNLDVSGYLGLAGSIYVGGSITKSGGIDINGVIVGGVDLTTNGGMTITRAQPPAFVQYPLSTGPGSWILSSETGPIF